MHDVQGALTAALAARYRVHGEIGRGGMATVYRADDLRQPRTVAIKVLRRELTAVLGPSRFRREIEILQALMHPNIVPMLDMGEAGELLYYVMPFVSGDSLRTRLNEKGAFALPRAVAIAQEVSAAIDYAHSKNVLHRDIKPENVLLERERAVVCDFGLARAIDRSATEPISSSGFILGTPAYMSPEQVMGANEIDGRCDIYALGCLIYEMLTGEVPFTGPTAQAIGARHLSERPRSIRVVRPEVPEHLEAAVLAALAKAPAARPGSGATLMKLMGEGAG
ncbi:MAG: serine/threonine-protein kinase [Gemmatimonadales bacterium]